MGVYSPYDVYPAWFDDEIDLSICEDCNFDCWSAGFCIKESN